MPLRVPYRRIARTRTGDWRQSVDLIDRNFEEIERVSGHWGVLSGTTDASAYLTVTHGAGFTPTAVLVTPTSPSSGANIFGQVIADSFTATTFRIRCFHPTGTGLAAVAVTGSYLCL